MEHPEMSMFYEDSGNGKIPAILLHGYPLDHTIWAPVVGRLVPHARVITPDLPGMGRSPLVGSVGMRAMAQGIADLMDVLALDKAVLVGHSMGGYVALSFAHAFPHRMLGLGLVSTQAGADSTERKQARLKSADEVKRKGVKVVAEAMAPKLTTHPELIPSMTELMMRTHPNGVVNALKGMAAREDATEWLGDITVPTVVITGSDDTLIPPEKSREMVQLLNRAWLVEIPGAGHMPMMENPDAVADALRALMMRPQQG